MKTVIEWSNKNMQIKNDAGVEINGSDKPSATGYTPIELLTSSLGLCIFITITRMFERDGIEENLEEFSVTVEAEKAKEGRSRIENFLVAIQMPKQLDASYRKKLIKSAERACTVGNTLQHGAEINITDGSDR